MKLQKAGRVLCIWTALFVSLFVVAGDTALAAHLRKDAETPSTEAQNPIKSATVNLYCRLKAGRRTLSASGSGVIISERGVILTNAHVAQYFLLAGEEGRVTGRCSVRTGSPAKERYTASVLYFPSIWIKENASELLKNMPKGTGENDFALLYITDTKQGPLPEQFPALPIALMLDTTVDPRAQERVTIAGYPTEKLDFDEVRKKLAIVTAPSTITSMRSFDGESADVLTLASSAAGSAGVSGGPVVDDSGEVIGIVTTRSLAKNGRMLRAITFAHIDRALESQTNRSLTSFLTGDLVPSTIGTDAISSQEILTIIEKSLLKKR